MAKINLPLAWTWQIRWSNPYTEPPHGQPRVRLSITRATPHAYPDPSVIDRAMAIIGYGRGWCVTCGPTLPPARKLSPEAKGKIRRRNLERRTQKAAPLFAADLIQIEIEKNPEYYRGE